MQVRDFAVLDRRASQSSETLREICGAFHSDRTGRLHLTFLKNRAQRSGHFLLNFKDIRFVQGKGPFWGIFHTHPLSDATPSENDINNGFGMALIYSDLEQDLRLWSHVRGSLVGRDVKRLGVQRRARG